MQSYHISHHVHKLIGVKTSHWSCRNSRAVRAVAFQIFWHAFWHAFWISRAFRLSPHTLQHQAHEAKNLDAHVFGQASSHCNKAFVPQFMPMIVNWPCHWSLFRQYKWNYVLRKRDLTPNRKMHNLDSFHTVCNCGHYSDVAWLDWSSYWPIWNVQRLA